jgi:cytochrome c oxidase subunit 3
MGMILFIVSEIMFFFAFFWAFFHSSVNPSIAIGGVWPPAYLTILDA